MLLVIVIVSVTVIMIVIVIVIVIVISTFIVRVLGIDVNIVIVPVQGKVRGIIKLKVAKLIDTLAIECHKPIGYCKQMIQTIRTMNPTMKVLFEQNGYVGWDSAFDPNEFYPSDPRKD